MFSRHSKGAASHPNLASCLGVSSGIDKPGWAAVDNSEGHLKKQVLRLRTKFASRNSFFAQDDKLVMNVAIVMPDGVSYPSLSQKARQAGLPVHACGRRGTKGLSTAAPVPFGNERPRSR